MSNTVEISVNGKSFKVPSVCIDGRTFVVNGKWIRTAAIHDEEWRNEAIDDPQLIIEKLRSQRLKADLFTFTQKLPDVQPKFPYPVEWDNLAVVRLTAYKDWWEGLPQETRKNVRRAEKRGVVVRAVPFDDKLIRGIKEIYDETPVRQGKRFWHYGKDLETVRAENSSYLDRAEFIGAFYQEELIGFIKTVCVGKASILMQIVSKNEHFDKRPTNGLIAKAVELSQGKGMAYLVYGRYVYGRNTDDPLTEFKRRNGFEQVMLPRYFVPLTSKGSVCLACRLHLGLRRWIPWPIEKLLLRLRTHAMRMGTAVRPPIANPAASQGPLAAGE